MVPQLEQPEIAQRTLISNNNSSYRAFVYKSDTLHNLNRIIVLKG